MNKQEYKNKQSATRKATRKAINLGLAMSLSNAMQWGLLAEIHKTVKPIAKGWNDVEFGVRGSQNQENEKGQAYVVDLQKYRDRFALGHKVASVANDNLAVENNPFASIERSKAIEPQSLLERMAD